MRLRSKRSRSMLFLSEIVLALVVFVVCAIICLSLLFQAQRLSSNSNELNRAVFLAQNVAEASRVIDNTAALADFLGGEIIAGQLVIFYDANWQVVQNAALASYRLQAEIIDGYLLREIIIEVKGAEPIFTLESTFIWGGAANGN